MQESISLSDAPTRRVPTPAQTEGVRPNAHTQKYDRQLRLWASTGQSALETASILVVSATATAASTLKNLVLPGIGQFTLLDDAPVTPADVGNNFFLEPSSATKPRAVEVARFVGELNSDVKGRAIVKSLESVLKNDAESLKQYSLIIAVNVAPLPLRDLARLTWESDIPFIKVKSCGFYGSLRTQVRELALVETHPESLIDLRIHSPFPELVAFARKFDYSKMDSEEHTHVPAIVILLKALDEWRSSHDDKGPTTSAERRQFVELVLKERRDMDEDNFDEAVALFRRAGNKNGVPSEIQTLFDDPKCSDMSPSVDKFWLLLHAVREFTRLPSSDGQLPLSGALPDMKASTSSYVDLQTIYKTKARQDLSVVSEILHDTLTKIGISDDAISSDEVETFVKHSAFLKVVRGTSLDQELASSKLRGHLESLKSEAEFSEVRSDALEIHIAFAAADEFFVRHGRWPGTDLENDDEDASLDVKELESLALVVVQGLEGTGLWERLQQVLGEVCRGGASDLPQMAALLGGLVAQEAIKLVTKQYVPLAATCVFNGITSASGIVDA